MKKKIIAMIPARIGSQRLKKKNLALINNKPLIEYVIQSAKKTKIFHKICINSDDQIFAKIALKNNIDFYLRKKSFGSSNTKSDDVVYDFLKNNKCDIVVWVNPIAPLQEPKEIKKVVNFFIKKKLNSLITTNKLKNHAIYKSKPLNYKIGERFAKTQDLKPLEIMVYSIMIWKASTFIKTYEKNKKAILHGKVGYYPVSKFSGIIVKDKIDLEIVSMIMKFSKKNNPIKYFK
jgi:CMP-N-acetylneuraminic acid synthetase